MIVPAWASPPALRKGSAFSVPIRLHFNLNRGFAACLAERLRLSDLGPILTPNLRLRRPAGGEAARKELGLSPWPGKAKPFRQAAGRARPGPWSAPRSKSFTGIGTFFHRLQLRFLFRRFINCFIADRKSVV